MPALNKDTIKQLSKLSRIDCSEDEQDELLKDLEKIIAYMEQLHQINTDNVPSCYNVIEGMNTPLREDVIHPNELLDREAFLANAPSHIGGMIRVPTVIKQHS